MEQTISFQPGDIILKEGEIGQAMYFIRSGSVDVFKKTPDGEVFLTLQNVGEVVGLLTFYSGEKRLATARARTYVECLRVEKEDHKDIIAKLPKWFQVVMKEFTLRLVQSNNQLAQMHDQNQKLKEASIDRLLITIQYVDCLITLSAWTKQKLDDGRDVLFLDTLLDHIESTLRYPRETLSEVQAILKDMGLLKVELEPDRNREIIQINQIEKLKWFTDFAHAIRTGSKKRLLDIRLSHKQRRQIYSLKEYVQKQGRDTHAVYSEGLAAFCIRFEELMKQPLDLATIEVAKQLKIMEASKKGELEMIAFQASTMVRTVLSLNTIRRLLSDPKLKGEGAEDVDLAS